jgi:alpha-galactosidase
MFGQLSARSKRVAIAASAAAITVASLAAAPQPASAAPQSTAIGDLAQVPYLGWNTYYGLGAKYDEQTIKDEAKAIVDRGLEAAGYQYVWLDAGWWSGTRDANGQITVSSTQWPDGMNGLADYVHSLGLKIGIYTDAGADGCAGAHEGSLDHYQQDANTFAAWGYDAVKVDFCGGEKLGLDPATQYGQFRDALQANTSHRPLLLNICNPFVPGTGAAPGRSAYDSWKFGPTTGNSWRTDTDIGFAHSVRYPDMLRNLDHDAAHPEAAGPGHWNDPDYLGPELGMTPNESQAQFSMWSMVAAPLIIGSDVRALQQSTIDMLSNPEVLAIDQDRLGKQGTVVSGDAQAQAWAKPLANGDRAVALFNRGDTATTISTSADAVGLAHAAAYTLRNVWTHTDTESAGTISAAVAPHSVVLLRVSPGGDLGHTAPAVTLSPASTPAAYPGSVLRLAVPGRPFAVSSALENDGRQPITDVSVTLDVPAGWTVSPAAATSVGTLPTGRKVALKWQVTPAQGALPGLDPLRIAADYSWSGGGSHHPGTAATDTDVQVPSAPPAGSTTLAHQYWLRGTSGYLVPRIDQEVAGGALRMNGVKYPSGLGVASPSTIEYYLGGRCTSLTATVGIDDSANFDSSGGTAVFQVLGDGAKLYDSGLVSRPRTYQFAVPLDGVDVVTLQVNDGGDGGYNDRADWGGLHIECAGPVGAPFPQFAAPAGASATSSNGGYPASNAVDGDLTTLWHSQFSPVHDALPVAITVDLGATHSVDGLTYQPRLDGGGTGTITGYTVATSADGVTWTDAATGSWPADTTLKSVGFAPANARFVRLTATQGAYGYASAAEIEVALAS